MDTAMAPVVKGQVPQAQVKGTASFAPDDLCELAH
jgi:hypothetical protein